jgi:CBS domain-containing protein
MTTTRPLLALTASDLMSRDTTTISRDTSLRVAAELFLRRRIGVAAVVDEDGRCVGVLSSTDLLRWTLEEARGSVEDISSPACPHQVKGRLLTGGNAAICTLTEGSCSLQEVRPMTGGRHTAVCRLREGVVSDWQEVSEVGPALAVQRYMTASFTVDVKAPLSVLVRLVVDVHVPTLIVVDEQDRPIGTVSCLEVLAALTRGRVNGVDG